MPPDSYCTCRELGPIEPGGGLLCIRCKRRFHACRYCPQIFYYAPDAIDHEESCDARTVLDDIVEALEAVDA